MNALFEIGQKVVCVDSAGWSTDGKTPCPLIEGKTYVVSNPNSRFPNAKGVTIKLEGMPVTWHFMQKRFVPIEFDRHADEAIHEALKGHKILN